MPLEEYARKRRSRRLRNPPRKGKKLPPRNYFCVQRHDATRLHYDFRLEIDGVLKSWAVPKGPTLDPTVKRLAAHVEDHPVEYGDFEGNIPKGNYGAGSVMLWDRGTFELLGDVPAQQQIARGDLKFRLHGEKLTGDFAPRAHEGPRQGQRVAAAQEARRLRHGRLGRRGARLVSVLSGRSQEEIAQNLPARKAKRKAAGAADRVWESSRPAQAPRQSAHRQGRRPPRKKKLDPDLQACAGAARRPRCPRPSCP